MSTPVTRFTYSTWVKDAGNATAARRHVGLIFSRMEPWHVGELVDVIDHQSALQEFLRYPDHPYFIIHCPPTTVQKWETHPLTRQPIKRTWRTPSKKEFLNRPGHYTGTPFVRKNLAEYRYIAVPSLTTVLARELHESTLEYKFTVVWDGMHCDFTYREMWNRCSIVQGMFQGSSGCPDCELHGTSCVETWLQGLLRDKHVPVGLTSFQHLGPERWRPSSAGVTYFEVPADWNEVYKKQFSGLEDTHLFLKPHEHQPPLPGMEPARRPAHLKFISRGKCKQENASPFTSKETYTPEQTYLDPETIEAHETYYKNVAAKAAKSRKQHNQICGTGDDACILRCEGCARWRPRYTGPPACQTRWHSVPDMLAAGVKRFKERVTYKDTDFRHAFNLSGHEFLCTNPETHRACHVVYGGLRFREGKAVHTIMRQVKSDCAEWFAGSWEELRCFVRRWAPWEASTFIKPEGGIVHVSDAMKLFYAECATPEVYWITSGWGGSYRHTAVSIRPARTFARYHARNTTLDVETTSSVVPELSFSSPVELLEYKGWRDWFTWIPQ